MSPDHNQVDRIISWMSSFDPSHLQNEDDVETKFILPLFRCLGYPQECRRGKFPIEDYLTEKRKPGRKPEIDQIYFLTKDKKEQKQDTSLLIVEAKEPSDQNFDKAIKQVRYYGNHMTPLFLVVTNGYYLKILKRHHLRGEEIIFDLTIDQLCSESIVTAIYQQLRFDQIINIKKQGTDPLMHALYIEMMDLARRNPDIQAQLTKGDFKPSYVREGRRLTVIKPKVAITCDLPIAFDEGSCTIEFSNIMLRGLTCHLSHTDILSSLLIGLKTHPQWETRPFLQLEKGIFKANLGQTTVILSEIEAYELCDAIDEVFQIYKELMIEATDTLETWDYLPTSSENEKGFEILSVKKWLWKLMMSFSYEFDYDNGTSDWHIFDRGNNLIRVEHKYGSAHVIIWPRVGTTFIIENDEWVDLLYVDCITYLRLYLDTPQETLYNNVGPGGIWTATYTKEWIIHQFIPKVVRHYSGLASTAPKKGNAKKLFANLFFSNKQALKLDSKQLNNLIQQSIHNYHIERKVQLSEISQQEELAEYLHLIQSFLLSYGAANVPASLLRPYYAALADIARCANTNLDDLNYLQAKLGSVQYWQRKTPKQHRDLTTYDDILKFLEWQVQRIHQVDHENHVIAELLSRAFIDIVETKITHLQQKQLNAAIKALQPLWEESRFPSHFIESIHWF